MFVKSKPSPTDLKNLALFGGVSDDALLQFSQLADRVEIEAGEIVYREGETARKLYIVAAGKVRVSKKRSGTGEEQVLTELGPGEFFGEMSFVDMQPRSATVQGLEPAALWVWPYTSLSGMYRRDGKAYTILVMNIARELSRRLRRADRMLIREGKDSD